MCSQIKNWHPCERKLLLLIERLGLGILADIISLRWFVEVVGWRSDISDKTPFLNHVRPHVWVISDLKVNIRFAHKVMFAWNYEIIVQMILWFTHLCKVLVAILQTHAHIQWFPIAMDQLCASVGCAKMWNLTGRMESENFSMELTCVPIALFYVIKSII